MRFRFKVKELAEVKGLTQDALARRAGLRLSAVIGVWRNTVETPRLDTLHAIAEALNVTVVDLYDVVETEPGQWIPTQSGRIVVIPTV